MDTVEIKVTEYLIKRLSSNYEVDQETGCYNYTGRKNQKGYGIVTASGKVVRAHRASYTCFIGPIENGLHVLHSCDNPSCINPKHLRTGTNGDNIADKVARKRAVRTHCRKCGEKYTLTDSGNRRCAPCDKKYREKNYKPVPIRTFCKECSGDLGQDRIGKFYCLDCLRRHDRERYKKRNPGIVQRGPRGDNCPRCGDEYEIKSKAAGRRFCRRCANIRRKRSRANS